MNPADIFTPPKGTDSPFTSTLTAYRVTPQTNERIHRIHWEYGLAKSEVVRYCLESALESVDWAKVARERESWAGE